MNPLTNIKNITKLNELEVQYGITAKNSWHQQYKDSAYIFIGGLPYELTEGDILCVFSQYGEIVNINLVRDKDTGKSKGYCFIAYEDQRSTILSVDNLNGIKLLNRTIRVDHVSNYRAPKEDENEDEAVKRLHQEGCAPKTPSPTQSDDDEKPANAKVKSKKMKEKKKKKKKRKKKKESSSDSESSESDEERTVKIQQKKADADYEIERSQGTEMNQNRRGGEQESRRIQSEQNESHLREDKGHYREGGKNRNFRGGHELSFRDNNPDQWRRAGDGRRDTERRRDDGDRIEDDCQDRERRYGQYGTDRSSNEDRREPRRRDREDRCRSPLQPEYRRESKDHRHYRESCKHQDRH